MFERYFGENSCWVPRESLSPLTRRNLRVLEREFGYQFEDRARKAKFGYRPSYIIFGTSSEGDEVVYERREPGHRAAGQTYVWVGGRKHRLAEYGLPVVSVAAYERDVLEKLREEQLSRELEEVDLGDTDASEQYRIQNMLDKISGRVAAPWMYRSSSLGWLTPEEREQVRKAVEEYRRKLEE